MRSRKIGIEVEVENTYVPMYIAASVLGESDYWEVVRDDSLRNGGFEVRTAGAGAPINKALYSLVELIPVMAGSSGSWRAGVHVHVDVSCVARRILGHVMAACYVVDRSLFSKFAPEREESNFCQPMYDKSYFVLNSIRSLLAGSTSDYGKYSSINFRPVTAQGTIEFRHLGTPHADREDYLDVRQALSTIESYASVCCGIVDTVVGTAYRIGKDTNRSIIWRTVLQELETFCGSEHLFIDQEALADLIPIMDAHSLPSPEVGEVVSLVRSYTEER